MQWEIIAITSLFVATVATFIILSAIVSIFLATANDALNVPKDGSHLDVTVWPIDARVGRRY